MRKFSNKFILGLAMTAVLGFTSCNSDDSFTYELPEQFENAQLAVAVAPSLDSQCAVDLTITADSKSTVYYYVAPSSDVAPDSSTIFSSPSSMQVEFSDAGSETVATGSLSESEEYTVYAISVNADGLRSEGVSTTTFVKGATEIMVDSTYTGMASQGGVDVLGFTSTLTLVSGNTYTVDTAWGTNYVGALAGSDFDGQFVYTATLTINADYSVTVTGDDAWATGSTSGTYDPCTNEISYSLTQALFSDPFVTDVVLTPDNI